MKNAMEAERAALAKLVEGNEITAGMAIRVRGQDLILSRDETPETGEAVATDRVKLTRLGPTVWGLSVKRHTGRWQKTPFQGEMKTVVEAIWGFMQHLVARY